MAGLPKSQLRHKAEMKMVTLAVLWGIIAIAAAILLAANHEAVPTWLKTLIFVGAISIVLIPIFFHYNYWKTIVDAVEVTPKQYPDIYKIFDSSAKNIGLAKTPRLYIVNGNGVMNAYATKCSLSKKYVVIYSDLLDVYSELGKKNEAMLRFVLSHELGHIYLGHVNARRSILQSLLRPIFLAKSFSRAQEYSADRVGASVTKNGTRAAALFPLYAGKRQSQHGSLKNYLSNDTNHISRFWVAIANFMADHPVGRRRLAALSRMDKEGWENIHGKML